MEATQTAQQINPDQPARGTPEYAKMCILYGERSADTNAGKPASPRRPLVLFDVVAATDAKGGMAKNGKLPPWRNTDAGREDMKFFKDLTAGSAVIMGRATWESIPARFRPLPGRLNIVMSRTHAPGHEQPSASVEPAGDDAGNPTTGPLAGEGRASGPVWVTSFDDALRACAMREKIFVIGGAEIYQIALNDPRVRHAYINVIDADYECDKFLGEVPMRKSKMILDAAINNPRLTQYTYRTSSHCISAEVAYLNLVREVIAEGERVPSRTGTPCRRLIGRQLRFPLRDQRGNTLPLLTTKWVNYYAVFHELIWFLRGETDTRYLQWHDVHIWDGNSSRAYLDSRGLTEYPEGTVGPIYGVQWRRWPNTTSTASDTPSREAHVDQIRNTLHLLREEPTTRRAVVSAWNPAALDEMALPPCHFAFQFIGTDEWISCVVTMRSGDLGLGIPFNAASYGLLTHMFARALGREAREVVINIGDCHVYENHVEGLLKQVDRTPLRPPKFDILRQLYSVGDMSGLAFDDTRVDYVHHPGLKLPMAV